MYSSTQSKMKKVKTLVAQGGGWRNVFNHFNGLKLAIDRYPAQIPCPKSGDGRTVFRLVSGWEDTGQAFHNHEGRLTDGLNVLAFYLGCSLKEAANEVLRITGGDISSVKKYEVTRQMNQEKILSENYCSLEERNKRLMALQKISAESIPAYKSPIAMNYLRSRGLTLTEQDIQSFSSTLGFHPQLSYYCTDDKKFKGKFPALLGIFKDKDGNNLTIHRIYLKPDGNGKAEVSNSKKLMSPPNYMGGGSFRLGEPMPMVNGGKYIGIAEGIETALAVHNANKLPCWALYSDTVLALFEPEPDITHVVIWADREKSKAGLNSAIKLRDKLRNKGVQCKIEYPEFLDTSKEDWLDVFVNCPAKIKGYIA